MDIVLLMEQNAVWLVPTLTALGILIGKMFSDSSTKKELEEAKVALVKTAKVLTPGLDLGYNLAVGNTEVASENLKQLAKITSESWTEAKNLSKEVNDVLVSLEQKYKN